MKKMIATVASVAALAAGGTYVGKQYMKPKRYIVFNKASFERSEASMLSIQTKSKIFSAMGTELVSDLPLINGYVVEGKPAAAFTTENSDWVVQEIYEHHTMSGAKPAPMAPTCFQCSGDVTPISCAGPAPSPTPTPTPTPEPTPVMNDPVQPGGVQAVHALAAQAALKGSKPVKVCVTDTGIDLRNGDIASMVKKSWSCAGNIQDGAGHGTHTAGTIAAITGNGYGVSSVGGPLVELYICKGLSDQGSGISDCLAQCVNWCDREKTQVQSHSWGSTQSDPIINQAMTLAARNGAQIFVAAGNDARRTNWPARLSKSIPGIYSITAMDKQGRKANFSSYGPETAWIAPGVDVESLCVTGLNCPPNKSFITMSGTSMATPHAAAVCAIGIAAGKSPCIKAINLGLTAEVQGAGMVDAMETLK